MINDYDYVYDHVKRLPPATVSQHSLQAAISEDHDYAYMEVMYPPAAGNPIEGSSKDQMINSQDLKPGNLKSFVDSQETIPAVNKCSPEANENPSNKQMINTQDFKSSDLELFVDSLETITRLETAKNKRHRQRIMKQNQDTPVASDEDADVDAESFYNDGNLNSIYHERHYAVPYKSGSSSSSSGSMLFSREESEESELFLNHSHASHFYEHIDIDPIRKRSYVITHPKSKSMKSRLISLIMKKQYLQKAEAAPITSVLSSTFLGENMEDSEIYERVLDDVVKRQYRKSPKKPRQEADKKQKVIKRKRCMKKNRKPRCPEYKFLNRALSLLSL